MHLGIAIGMGIFSFGIIMIITYILFLGSKSTSFLFIGQSFRFKQFKTETWLKNKKYYVVWEGHTTRYLYQHGLTAQKQINGFAGARFKSFAR